MEVDPSGVHMPTDGITSWLPFWGSSGIWFGFSVGRSDRRAGDQPRQLRIAVGDRPRHQAPRAGRCRPSLVEQAEDAVRSVLCITNGELRLGLDRAPAQRGRHRQKRPDRSADSMS